MEGARRSFPLILVIFGTLLEGNVGHEQPYHTRREVVVDEEVNRCTALVRRTSIERQLVSYPCFRPVPGITPVVAHQSPAGLVCKGYTSVPATNYYRVKMCCPGWSHDQQGRCVVRGGRQLIVQKSILPKKSLDQLTKYPASYEDRRNKMLQLLQPFLTPLFQQHQQSPPTWEDMAAPRGQWEEMARNSQSWENIMRQRMQEVVRQRAIMRQRYIRHMQEQMYRQIQMALSNRMVPFSLSAQLMTRIPNLNRQVHVLRRPQQTSRAPDNLVSPPVQQPPFHQHPQMPQIPVKPFPQIPNMEQRPNFPNHHHMHHGHPPMMMHQGPRPQRPMMMGHHHPGQHNVPQIPALPNNLRHGFPGVQLPQIPIEMPPVNVQPGPNSPFGPPQCFDNYNTVVKKCYGESGAALPNGDNMFSEMAYELKQVCAQRNSIIDCIQQHFPRCHHPQEQMMIRGSFETTITELHGMCEMNNIDPVDKSMQTDNTNNNIEELSQTNEETIETRFTGDVPVKDNKPETKPVPVKPEVNVPIKTESKTEDKPKHNIHNVKSDKDVKVKQEVKTVDEPKKDDSTIEKNKLSAQRAHDIMVEELEQEVHHHYLPLLIGTAVAIGAIVILLITLVCLCCRRRMKKKIYIEKEPEKPKLLDGIYTIGVPPPIYEVNGIPPLSYEEAKGLKISGTPTSTRKNMDNEINDQQESSSVNGVVSDI